MVTTLTISIKLYLWDLCLDRIHCWKPIKKLPPHLSEVLSCLKKLKRSQKA